MNKQILAKISSIIVTSLFIGAEIVLFLTLGRTIDDSLWIILGLVLALLFVTPIHELGHILFASIVKMRVVYLQLGCLLIRREGGRYALKLANPLWADET